jgi:SAM-dependent methyltransferase
MAQQGLGAIGVDFSPVAIAKARKRTARDERRAEYLVGDVTNLNALTGPFDVSFDVGCFHCLDTQGQQAYVSQVSRLLKPGGTHLIWAMDSAASGLNLSPAIMKGIFGPGFELRDAQKAWRRLAASHWYWLIRSSS